MVIKTGYFAQHKRYNKAGYTLIGVVRFVPKWFTGLNLAELSPSIDLLIDYKQGVVSWNEFESSYFKYLNDNKDKIESSLKTIKDSNTDKVVLCCFEKSNEPCHRHILASFLNQNYRLDISEFEV